jgi:hypothetical protein
VSESEIQLARQGTSSDRATAAIVAFAQQVLAAPAEIGDADVDRLRTHGYRDEQIAEVAGLVALQLLTGAFNLIADIHATPEGAGGDHRGSRALAAPALLAREALGLRRELGGAGERAEEVGRVLIGEAAGRALGIDGHPADAVARERLPA